MDYETVWHGALWREVAPERLEPVEDMSAYRVDWSPSVRASHMDRLWAAIGEDWTERQDILSAAGVSNGSHTSALLSRLWARGLVERQELRLHRKGRPSYLYRRRRQEVAA